MKRTALVVFGLMVSLVFTTGVFASSTCSVVNSAVSRNEKVTVDVARKAALEKVPGTVQDEYTLEDDDEEITHFVFIIQKKDKKIFAVEVSAENGKVTSVEEQEQDEDDPDDPSNS